MADFADFVMRVAPLLGAEGETEGLLNRLSGQQVSLASEDEALFELVDLWLKDDSATVNIERDVSLGDLRSEVERLDETRPLPWARGNPKSFGQHFRGLKGTLGSLYGMTERSGHGGTVIVSFQHGRG